MASDKTTLGDRMKEYEASTDFRLNKEYPLVIRLDGAHFHTWTKRDGKLDKPYDKDFMEIMERLTYNLSNEIPNVVYSYTQSDEITLVVFNNLHENSEPWLSNRLEKICSTVAALASVMFNAYVSEKRYMDKFKYKNLATFDCRVFNVPYDDLPNNILWRTQDAKRNSIQNYARSLYSNKELNFKKTEELKQLMLDKGVNWDEQDPKTKYGTVVRLNLDEDKKTFVIESQLNPTGTEISFYNVLKKYFDEVLNYFKDR